LTRCVRELLQRWRDARWRRSRACGFHAHSVATCKCVCGRSAVSIRSDGDAVSAVVLHHSKRPITFAAVSRVEPRVLVMHISLSRRLPCALLSLHGCVWSKFRRTKKHFYDTSILIMLYLLTQHLQMTSMRR